jgi:hypothetical protein
MLTNSNKDIADHQACNIVLTYQGMNLDWQQARARYLDLNLHEWADVTPRSMLGVGNLAGALLG